MLNSSEAFPDFERFDCKSFQMQPPIKRNPVLYPAELRGHSPILRFQLLTKAPAFIKP